MSYQFINSCHMAKTAAVSPDYDGYKDGSVEPGYCGLPGYRLHETISTPTRDVGVCHLTSARIPLPLRWGMNCRFLSLGN